MLCDNSVLVDFSSNTLTSAVKVNNVGELLIEMLHTRRTERGYLSSIVGGLKIASYAFHCYVVFVLVSTTLTKIVCQVDFNEMFIIF